MPVARRLVAGVAVAGAALLGFSAPAFASPHPHPHHDGAGDHVVFVQTDNPAGNQVVAYDRGADGRLTEAGVYATGGKGGQLAGSVVDHTASQGSLTYDPATHQLLAVNAGSDTVSVFAVHGDRLALRQIVASGGEFPVSVAAHGPDVYVLDALGGGAVQGFFDLAGYLLPLPGTHRTLGLDPNATPQFTSTPGQVAVSPDGRQLVVTTKANGNDVDVFGIGPFGTLSPAPVVNSEPNAVPFAVAWGAAGQLLVAEAGPNAVASFRLERDGVLAPLGAVATGQAATCWIAGNGSTFYASNAGSGTLSTVAATPDGHLTVTATTATDAGTVDAALTPDGGWLYAQTGAAGVVDAFRVGPAGSLSEVGRVTVPDAVGGEGIVAL